MEIRKLLHSLALVFALSPFANAAIDVPPYMYLDTESPTGLYIHWRGGSGTVHYGINSTRERTATGTNSVHLQDLRPGAEYTWFLKVDDERSETGSFRLDPGTGEPFKAAVIADPHLDSHDNERYRDTAETLAWINETVEPALVVAIGDFTNGRDPASEMPQLLHAAPSLFANSILVPVPGDRDLHDQSARSVWQSYFPKLPARCARGALCGTQRGLNYIVNYASASFVVSTQRTNNAQLSEDWWSDRLLAQERSGGLRPALIGLSHLRGTGGPDEDELTDLGLGVYVSAPGGGVTHSRRDGVPYTTMDRVSSFNTVVLDVAEDGRIDYSYFVDGVYKEKVNGAQASFTTSEPERLIAVPNTNLGGNDRSVTQSAATAKAAGCAGPKPAQSSADEALVMHYSMDEGCGSTIGSSTRSRLVANLKNGPSWTSGRLGAAAIKFDGNDDYVDVGRASISGKHITLSAWINPTSLDESRIISKASGGTARAHYWMLSSYEPSPGKHYLRFRLKTNGTTDTLMAREGALRMGKWHHAMATYDGANMRLYLDGKEVAKKPKTGRIDTNDNIAVNVARNPDGTRHFAGTIDDVRIYAGSVSAAGAQALAQRTNLSSGHIRSDGGGASTPAPEASPPLTTQTDPVPSADDSRGAAQPNADAEDSLPPAVGWPTNADGDLPLGGVFYGASVSGRNTGNASIAYDNAIRFRAQRSGKIVGFGYNNRLLNQSNISDRCRDKGSEKKCLCHNNGLDKYSCGYVLGNSYHVGNGGLILGEIRADDGSSRHLPSSKVLGQMHAPFVPMDYEKKKHLQFQFKEPITVRAGQYYHLVLRNLNPPKKCKLNNNSVSDAKNKCERNAGAIGLNGIWHGEVAASVGGVAAGRWGPFAGSHSGTALRGSVSSGKWKEDENNLPFYEVKYSDGVWTGMFYTGIDSQLKTGFRIIEGNTRGRQIFTVQRASREVDGVWVNFGHKLNSRANGKPMSVQLKDKGGSVLASGSIPYSKQCADSAASPSDAYEKSCKAWGYTKLNRAVKLAKGATYSLELSAPAGAGFNIYSYIHKSGTTRFFSEDINLWDDAHAEASTNDGKSWNVWDTKTKSYANRDIPVLFTLKGMPRALK